MLFQPQFAKVFDVENGLIQAEIEVAIHIRLVNGNESFCNFAKHSSIHKIVTTFIG